MESIIADMSVGACALGLILSFGHRVAVNKEITRRIKNIAREDDGADIVVSDRLTIMELQSQERHYEILMAIFGVGWLVMVQIT